ncbi:MAG: Arm DNA-binding domain-containing protein [Daejeonella sp.]
MKTNFNLLFYMKKPKNYVSGNAPIYLRITVEGKRSEVFTGRDCDPKRWNAAAGRANGIKEEVKSFNAYLDNLQSRVYDAHRELMDERSDITAEAIRDKFAGKKQTQRFLLEVLKEHNSKLEALIGNGFAANTLKGYRTTVKHLTAFLKQKYNTSDG